MATSGLVADMAVYKRQQMAAKRMIRKKGELCQWVIPASQVENPDEPWNSEPIQEVIHKNIPIVFVPTNNKGLETLASLVIGSQVASGNVKGFMATVPFTPSKDHTVIRKDGRVLTIETIDEVNPNGESILFEIGFTQ